ncbi:exfoliative toxin [Streptococcus pyogenes]|nr:exfoliative toxin [Streptococcus pyogenes]
MIDLKRNLFKIDVRAQKDEEKVFMRTACIINIVPLQIKNPQFILAEGYFYGWRIYLVFLIVIHHRSRLFIKLMKA